MRLPLMAALWLAASRALAQDAVAASDEADATTLETLTVRPEPEEVVDLYRFRNPIEVEPGTFERTWREPTSLEQLGKNGGIVPVLAGLAAKGIPTSRLFRKDERVRLPLIQAAAAVSADFGQVQSIVPAGPEAVRITGENGQSVTCPINWQFLKS